MRTATMGGMAVGSVLGYSSPAEAIFNEPTTHNSTTWLPLGHMQMSWFEASPCLGAGMGAVAGGVAINLVGRRITMLASFPLFLLNWILVGGSINTIVRYRALLITHIYHLHCLMLPLYILEKISKTKTKYCTRKTRPLKN